MKDAVKIDATTPVGLLARLYPAAIAVFEAMDIEYACKGGRSLAEAATASGLDVREVMAALRGEEPGDAEPTITRLTRAIAADHRLEQQRLAAIVAGLAEQQTDAPEIVRLRRLFATLSESVIEHMRREENDLFEPIQELERRPHTIRAGSISRRMFIEFVEHDVVHDKLVKIRELVLRLRGRQLVPESLLDQIIDYDRSAHRHMHLENNVLIPRTLDLENRLRSVRNTIAGTSTV